MLCVPITFKSYYLYPHQDSFSNSHQTRRKPAHQFQLTVNSVNVASNLSAVSLEGLAMAAATSTSHPSPAAVPNGQVISLRGVLPASRSRWYTHSVVPVPSSLRSTEMVTGREALRTSWPQGASETLQSE